MSAFQVSTGLHVEHRRPSAGDAPHEGLLKSKGGGLGFRSLGFRSLGFRSLGFRSLGFRSLGSFGFRSLGFRSLGSLGSFGFRSLGVRTQQHTAHNTTHPQAKVFWAQSGLGQHGRAKSGAGQKWSGPKVDGPKVDWAKSGHAVPISEPTFAAQLVEDVCCWSIRQSPLQMLACGGNLRPPVCNRTEKERGRDRQRCSCYPRVTRAQRNIRHLLSGPGANLV